MMKIFLILFTVFISTSPTVQSQEKLGIPPGTILLKNNLYIDKAPVTNLMFLEYLTAKHSIRKNGFHSFSEFNKKNDEKIMIVYPSFLKNLDKKESLLTKKNYFKNIKYKYSPVLRISKEQAIDYCKWRTEMVKHVWSNNNNSINQNIKYRLPKMEEILLAQEYFSERKKFKYDNGKNPTKFKTDKIVSDFIKKNISEFTISDKIFGKNWKGVSPTEFPNDVTGFRCVCEIQP